MIARHNLRFEHLKRGRRTKSFNLRAPMTPQAIKLGQLRFAELPRCPAYDHQQISFDRFSPFVLVVIGETTQNGK
jgi:hypothetical protein